MAISVVLLEKITQITCILYFKFVNIYFVKSIYMVQYVSKVLLTNFRITKLHVLCVYNTNLDQCIKLFPQEILSKESGVWYKQNFSDKSKTMKVFSQVPRP